jgi:hypothetical protein
MCEFSARLFSRLCRRCSAFGQHSLNRGWVTSQLIGDHDAWFIADVVDHLPKEAVGGVLIAPQLHQDVKHDTVLIDRPP